MRRRTRRAFSSRARSISWAKCSRRTAPCRNERGGLLQLDFDESVFAIGGVDDVVLNTLAPEIGRAGFHVGKGFAVLRYDLQLSVHQRHDDVVVPVSMPAGVVAAL